MKMDFINWQEIYNYSPESLYFKDQVNLIAIKTRKKSPKRPRAYNDLPLLYFVSSI